MICGFAVSFLFLNSTIICMEPEILQKNKERYFQEYQEIRKLGVGLSFLQWLQVKQPQFDKNTNEWQILQYIIDSIKNKDYYKKKYMKIIRLSGKDPVSWTKKNLSNKKLNTPQYEALSEILQELEQPRSKEGAGIIPTPPSSPGEKEIIKETKLTPTQQNIMQRWFPNVYQYWQRSAAAVGPYLSSAQQKLKDLYNQYQTKIKYGVGAAAAIGGLGALYWKYGRGSSNQ